CEGWKGEAAIVDVDSTDRWREIVIPQSGMDIESVLLIRFDGKDMKLVGHVPDGHPTIDGSGTIQTRCRGRILCDWFFPTGYRWNAAGGAFVEVPLAFKPMKVEVTLKRELALSQTPVSPFSRYASLAPGTRATIDLTDDVMWCHIRSEDGRAGWFFLQDGNKFSDGADVQAMFDGLPLAD
ncbi:MAG TPA: hypothetical protein VJS69_10590, partial [Candidatus Krumholzibacteria bacterium]|nr:hypothetical protein [Candidatus Krumholzibacteria bacterium]